MDDYAVVLTHDRPELLRRCIDAAAPQVRALVVVDNASQPPVDEDAWSATNVTVIRVPDQPPNLSRLWNAQLDRIQRDVLDRGDEIWNVALLCDDVLLPSGWYARVRDGMRAAGVAAASAHSYEPQASPYVLTALTNGPDRMCPWAFMLAGERGLRADESMAWWYCDTDLDWQARRAGGTLIVPGEVATNALVGDWTARRPELGARTHLDRAAFSAKWGLG